MMPSTYLGVAHPAGTLYPTDTFLDDLSRQMAASQASRRLSRGAAGQHHRPANSMGNAMRIVKPSSANNSPLSSTMAARRRTIMNETTVAARRRQQMGQAVMPTYTPEAVSSQPRSTRPVSWHPSSYPQHEVAMSAPYQQQHQNFTQYPFPATLDGDLSAAYQPHFSPVPAYSCSTSPNSSFSPASLPYNTFDSTPYLPVEGWNVPQHHVPAYVSSCGCNTEPFPALPTSDYASTAAAWASFASQGFSSTSPPTPENLPQSQQPQPAVSSEESIPYQSLDEPEEEGEILIGMGLYDAPEKIDDDPHLSHSRSAMSSLLSAPRRREGTGKGLKLEEAWCPPESDDEQDDDADGDDQEDEQEERVKVPQAA